MNNIPNTNIIPPSPNVNPQNLKPFAKFCVTLGALPTSYIESLSYLELLLWLCNYLEKTVIPAINNNAEALAELQQLFVELKDYVDNYFKNLDVQQEINNKLDEMAEDGTLQEIITSYLQINGVLAFDTVSDMKSASNLVDGSTCKTLGFYEINDGGGAFYKIKTVDNQDDVDNMFIIPLNNTSLVAELIFDKILNIDCLGAKDYYVDNNFDNTEIIQKAIDKFTENNGNGGTILFSPKTYKVNSTITIKPYIILKGESLSTTGNLRGTSIYATIPKDTDLFKLPTVTEQANNGYITMENLNIYGYGNGTALNLNTIMHSHFKNLNILYFQIGIRLNGGMLNTFENLNIRYFYEFGILIDNGLLNTRQFFNNCYIGQTNYDDRDSAIPLYICRNAIIDSIFTNCTVESTRQGIFITSENHVEFNGLYTENAPSVARPLFNIGILSDDSAFASSTTKDNSVVTANLGSAGQVIISGSFFQGSPSIPNNTANKNFLHLGYVDLISISNSKIRAFNYMWDNLENIRSKILFSSCEANTFGTRAFAYDENVEFLNCRYTDSQTNYDNFNNVMKVENGSANANAVNWYRVCEISNSDSTANILDIHSNYSTTTPISILLGVTTTNSRARIKLLTATASLDNTINQVRITQENDKKYIEVHYYKTTANKISVRLLTPSNYNNINVINPTPVTSEPTVLQTIDILDT